MSTITDNGFARISKETLIRNPSTPGAVYGGTIAYDETNTLNEIIDTISSSITSGTVTSISSTSSDATITNPTTTPAITIVSAPKLTNARHINGIAFDGTGDITISDSTKVVSNTAITGATKTKVTYDSKGLVTSGADATTADITASTDKNYVTDAQLVVIGNTSGTNSGNQTIANTSDATSHTATLSATGGSLKFVEGANITITTTGTSADGIITIASSGGSGSGDVVGPASATDNAIARFDATTGKLIQNSAATIDDSGNITATNLSGTNTGNQTSIVGITGTKAQFDTAVTDGNILYIGDITQYTDEMAQDATGAMVDTSLVYTDGTPLLQRAALTGAITASVGSNATALGSFTTAQLNTALSDNDIATGGGTASGTNTGDNAANTTYASDYRAANFVAGTNYVAPNAAITGATKTKITYDAKGLVTAGADATTADIADSTNKRYVTDANLTTIGNQSGTNTGDNATNSLYSGLVSNATHTGEVTGATALTVDKTVITNKTTITADAADFMLVSDTSDSGNLKKVAVPTGGGSGDMTKSIYDIDNIGLDIFQYARRMALIF